MRRTDVPLDAADLDGLDRAILDVLQAGRERGEPWGIATPTVVREMLRERGYGDGAGEEGDDGLPVRQTINNHLRKLEYAGHLRNRYDTGEYEFVSDPRNAPVDD